MKILDEIINKDTLLKTSTVVFDENMIKAVVDIERELIAIDANMHVDLEQLLLENGSRQEDLWGINFHPEEEEFVEFDSMINIKPRQNKHLYVDDEETRNRIIEVVNKWISQD